MSAKKVQRQMYLFIFCQKHEDMKRLLIKLVTGTSPHLQQFLLYAAVFRLPGKHCWSVDTD